MYICYCSIIDNITAHSKQKKMRTRHVINPSAEKLESKRRALKDKQYKKQHEESSYYYSPDDRRPPKEDVHHSRDTPCCQPALDVMEKIFPEIVVQAKPDTQEDDEKSGEGDGGAEEEQKQQEEAKERDDLMAKLVRKHLLEERRKVRGPQPGAGGGGKKKKKKKRKKGGAGAAAAGAAAAASTTAAGEEKQEQGAVSASASSDQDDINAATTSTPAGGDSISSDKDAATASASPSGVAQLQPSSAKSEPAGSSSGAGAASAAGAASRSNDNENNTSKADSPLDTFLDKLLQTGADKNYPIPANRDLASFVDFLNARYELYVQQTDAIKAKKRIDKNERICKTSDVIPSIRFGLLERYSDAVKEHCRPCWMNTMTQIQNSNELIGCTKYSFTLDDRCMDVPRDDEKLELQSREFALKHVSDTEEGYEIEQAFDYVALEEGFGDGDKANAAEFRLVVEGVMHHRKRDAFDFTAVDEGKNKPNMLEMVAPNVGDGAKPYILSLHDVVRLVTRVVVPGGLDLSATERVNDANADDIAVVEDIYSDADKRTLIHQVGVDYIETYAGKLRGLQSLQDEIKDKNREALESRQQGDFAAKAAKAIRECEKACDNYLFQAGVFAENLTMISVGLCSTDGRVGEWARDIIQAFMDVISNAHTELIKPSIAYKQRVYQTSKRPGSVPSMAFSASHRDVFESMLEYKIETTNMIHKTFMDKLMDPCPPQQQLNGIQCLCFASAYYAFPNETPLIDPTDADKKAKEIVAARQEMCWKSWQDTVIAKESLLAKQLHSSSVCSRKLDELERAIDIENSKLDDVGSDLGPLTDLVSRQTCEEVKLGHQMPDLELVDCIEEGDPAKLAELAERGAEFHNRRAAVLTTKWWLLILRQYRQGQKPLFQPYTHGKPRLEELPKTFLQWVKENHAGDEGGDFNDAAEDVCAGLCGRRRISCLIAVMLYDWLQERCVEWNAELTQKELLVAMENDDQFFASELLSANASNADKGSGKASKKKKKKAKKKAAAAAVATAAETPPPPPAAAAAAAEAAAAEAAAAEAASAAMESTPDTEVVSRGDSEKKEVVSAEDSDTSGGWILNEHKRSASKVQSSAPSTSQEDDKECSPDAVVANPVPSKEERKSPATGKGKGKPKAGKGTKAAKSKKKKDSGNQTSAVPKEKEQVKVQDEEQDAPFEYVSKVAVQDGSELIPAEYYLVRRLKAIMSKAKENASDESKRAIKEKIVFL